jgi:hypothetical protein
VLAMRSAGRVKRPQRWGVGRRARGHAALVLCWPAVAKHDAHLGHTQQQRRNGTRLGFWSQRQSRKTGVHVASPTRTQRTSEHQARARRPIAGHGASVGAVVWGEGGLGSHRRSDEPAWVVRATADQKSNNKQHQFLKKQRQPISIFGALLEFYVFSVDIQKQTNKQSAHNGQRRVSSPVKRAECEMASHDNCWQL